MTRTQPVRLREIAFGCLVPFLLIGVFNGTRLQPTTIGDRITDAKGWRWGHQHGIANAQANYPIRAFDSTREFAAEFNLYELHRLTIDSSLPLGFPLQQSVPIQSGAYLRAHSWAAAKLVPPERARRLRVELEQKIPSRMDLNDLRAGASNLRDVGWWRLAVPHEVKSDLPWSYIRAAGWESLEHGIEVFARKDESGRFRLEIRDPKEFHCRALTLRHPPTLFFHGKQQLLAFVVVERKRLVIVHIPSSTIVYDEAED